MSPDSHNPPLPGKGIEADPAEPPFTRAVLGEGEPKPEALRHNLNLTPRHVASLTPDGRMVDTRTTIAARTEQTRQDAIAARAERIQPDIERDGAQGPDLSKLQRDFDDARHNRR